MKTMYFVRHTKTNSAREAGDDFSRTLTDLGRHQALQTRAKIGGAFDVVISSPAPRAVEVGKIIANGNTPMFEVPALFWHPDPRKQALLATAWETYGYKPYREYLEIKDVAPLIKEMSEAAQDQLSGLGLRHSEVHDAKTILFVGHYTTINDLIYRSLDFWGVPEFADFVKEIDLEPGEVFKVVFPDQGNPITIEHIILD